LKEKQTKKIIKKNNNQENEYHIWYNNKTKSMKMDENEEKIQNKERAIKRKRIIIEFFSPLFFFIKII